ncbi:relaxase/mobilization nuclease domain-containing protein, partial [Mesorhizobium sp. M7A.F.Ca.MR.362.00.0.0]|uniref:relaxase/mobilization nuclease domain-containing protein n=1 Tax=Mesorhizobium sp. M7A.F.Ca.MR.362.00.0.0 TaxID=2496779 RepID=UPI0019D45EB9
IHYCEKEIILDPETGQHRNKCILKAGVNCDIADIREDFAETRHYFDKTDGRQAMHFVLSFHPNELPNTPDNYEKCLEIGMNLAAQISKGHESGCFVHSDQEHLHCHIVTNSVNYENGRKFHMEKNKDLVLFRHISDQICKEYGIEPLESYKGEHVQEKNAEKRIKARGGVTWKDEIREAISYAKERANNIENYKELLAEKGIEMYLS